MASKKISPKLSPSEENLLLGHQIIRSHPLFSNLSYHIVEYDKTRMGKDCAALVDCDGYIGVNKDLYLSPKQWAYAIAHCQLHLAFGHFDAEKMPGYFKEKKDGTTEKVVSCHKAIWNIACDLYIYKFLQDIKFGEPFYVTPDSLLSMPLTDEVKIYNILIEKNISETHQLYGVATTSRMDMLGLEKPIVYATAKDVSLVRIVFCDADAYDTGYLSPQEIAGRVTVKGRGGTLLQPGIDLLEKAKDFPTTGPILIITDGWIEDRLYIKREHAFLLPQGHHLPFRPKGPIFYFKE